jgi:hypothetical protein
MCTHFALAGWKKQNFMKFRIEEREETNENLNKISLQSTTKVSDNVTYLSGTLSDSGGNCQLHFLAGLPEQLICQLISFVYTACCRLVDRCSFSIQRMTSTCRTELMQNMQKDQSYCV